MSFGFSELAPDVQAAVKERAERQGSTPAAFAGDTMSAALALRPDEMAAAKRALDRLKAPAPALPSPPVVKAALARLAPPEPPAPLPLPPPRNTKPVFPPGEAFIAGLEAEACEERRLVREAAKLEPIVITISDQAELRRIHELAERSRDRPIPMLRRHLRGWSREKLEAARIEQHIA